MADTSDVNWTLWVFAGPGAFMDKAVTGEVLPLADVVGELPAGVAMLAQANALPQTALALLQ